MLSRTLSSVMIAALVALSLVACKKRPPTPMVEPIAIPAVSGNPFVDTRFYVRQDWAEQVRRAKRAAPDDLQSTLDQVAAQPVAIWLDRIAAIHGEEGLGLADHLDQAVRQQRQEPGTAMLAVIVVYNLPNRDCAAAASAGELRLDNDGLRTYKEDYIDPIAEIAADPAYRNLRLVFVIEPDGLANLVTNMEEPQCAEAAEGYRAGVAHAITALSAPPNTHLYLDMAHAGWLGWEHGAKAAMLYRDVLSLAGGPTAVRGFATNVSNYVPTHESQWPYGDVDANKQEIEQFYQWNRMVDSRTYVDSLRSFFPNHGFIVDTGRSGWANIGDKRRDQRAQRSDWCNVVGPGLGERVQADPEDGIDAFYWVKPPGESDGTGSPNDPRSDPACDIYAPSAGGWFDADLIERVQRAQPPFTKE